MNENDIESAIILYEEIAGDIHHYQIGDRIRNLGLIEVMKSSLIEDEFPVVAEEEYE